MLEGFALFRSVGKQFIVLCKILVILKKPHIKQYYSTHIVFIVKVKSQSYINAPFLISY